VPGGVELWVRAKPRASRPGIGPVREAAVEVRIGAPPVEGAANAELVQVLAEALGVPPRTVTLLHGERGRNKRFHIAGLTLADARARLGLPLQQP
jgi:uncharacterized protein (TIGR00251 family)